MPKTLKGETLGRRSLLHVLFLHLGIRIRYLVLLATMGKEMYKKCSSCNNRDSF